MTEVLSLRLRDHDTQIVRRGASRDSDPIILVHALGLDHRMWTGVAEIMSTTHELLAYDTRLHGSSANAPIGALSDYVSDLLEIFDLLQIEHAHLAGISMGGAIAATFAAQHTSRVRSLALICAPARAVDAFEERAVRAERDGIEAQIEPTLQRWFDPEALQRNDSAVVYAREQIQAATIARWAASWRALAQFEAYPLPASLPVTLIAGSHDASTPPNHMRGLLGIAPHAEFQVIEKGTHMLALEHPGKLAPLLEKAVQSN